MEGVHKYSNCIVTLHSFKFNLNVRLNIHYISPNINNALNTSPTAKNLPCTTSSLTTNSSIHRRRRSTADWNPTNGKCSTTCIRRRRQTKTFIKCRDILSSRMHSKGITQLCSRMDNREVARLVRSCLRMVLLPTW